MYAIIDTDGRQYRVEEGLQLNIDFRHETSADDEISFDRVLLVGGGDGEVRVGTPVVEGASVKAKVLGPVKGEKLTVQKFRRRKNSRRRTGHRSIYTRIQISQIAV